MHQIDPGARAFDSVNRAASSCPDLYFYLFPVDLATYYYKVISQLLAIYCFAYVYCPKYRAMYKNRAILCRNRAIWALNRAFLADPGKKLPRASATPPSAVSVYNSYPILEKLTCKPRPQISFCHYYFYSARIFGGIAVNIRS